MGQKVHPHGFRLGYIRNWDSLWYADKKSFSGFVIEDHKIRKFVKKTLAQAAVSKVEIKRTANKIRVIVHSARPGIIIGRRGAEIDRLRDQVQTMTGKQIYVDIKEIKSASADAQLVAENIAFQLEKRIQFRRAMKKAVQNAIDQGVEGIKIQCKGRLGGSEIARSEKTKVGKVPLQTLRADIEYGFTEAHTTFGLVGIKVWICKGEKMPLYYKEEGKSNNGVDAKTS